MSESATTTPSTERDYGAQKSSSESMQPVPDLVDYVRDYARQKPEVAAMWCFGIGFILGWKLKPW
jgi:hypothetical protein